MRLYFRQWYEKVIFSLALGTFEGLGMAVWHYGRSDGAGTRCRDNDSRRRAYDLVLRLRRRARARLLALFSSRFSLALILLFLVTVRDGQYHICFSSSYLMLAVGRLVSAFRTAPF